MDGELSLYLFGFVDNLNLLAPNDEPLLEVAHGDPHHFVNHPLLLRLAVFVNLLERLKCHLADDIHHD
jgi:hypothetical protein